LNYIGVRSFVLNGAPTLTFPLRQHRKFPPFVAVTTLALRAGNGQQAKSAETAAIGGEKVRIAYDRTTI
jgi:hypothetical protein